jgi:acyl-CoA reductase-like NAD-dependent aldehyde dehydrogenase
MKMSHKNAKQTAEANQRLDVLKTYKMYVGGAFPRSESGRSYSPQVNGKSLGNICRASRKDVRDAVVAARGAQSAWWARSTYLRGQILYRIAEILQGRSAQFHAELQTQGLEAKAVKLEVAASIDRLIYYAGWCDKYQQIFSTVNPVASSHFNFSILEPTGVVGVLASETSPLLGLLSLMAPIIAGGNTCIVLASESRPLSAVTFGEVLHASDVPSGVVNLLTGYKSELAEHFASHMDINAVAYDGDDPTLLKRLQMSAANVKRIKHYDCDWRESSSEHPYLIRDFSEVKTTWHPIERISASGSGY